MTPVPVCAEESVAKVARRAIRAGTRRFDAILNSVEEKKTVIQEADLSTAVE